MLCRQEPMRFNIVVAGGHNKKGLVFGINGQVRFILQDIKLIISPLTTEHLPESTPTGPSSASLYASAKPLLTT